MAIPRGYKRGSGGFLEPVGSRPSGLVSGPTFAQRQVAAKAGMKKVAASFEKAQKVHEGVMAGISKAETDTFKRLNDALNASKESDPKDKLGNTVPSAQTKYLEQQLIGHMTNRSQRGQRLTPEVAGVTPGQQKTFREEGPTEQPMEPFGPRGLLPQHERPAAELRPAFRTPIEGTKMIHPNGEVTLTGETRTGPNGEQEVEATMGGQTGWVPMKSLRPVEPEGEGGLAQLQRLFRPPERDFQPF